MTIRSVRKVRRRWECKLGWHRWEPVRKFNQTHQHCFSCGKDK